MTAVVAALVAATLGWTDTTPVDVVLAGEATYYDEGVMARVVTNRLLLDDPADYPEWLAEQGLVGAVALNRAGDLGRLVWLDGPQGIEGPFLVADCAQRRHYDSREARSRIVEVDRATARRWAMAGPLPARVWFYDPQMPAGAPVPT